LREQYLHDMHQGDLAVGVSFRHPRQHDIFIRNCGTGGLVMPEAGAFGGSAVARAAASRGLPSIAPRIRTFQQRADQLQRQRPYDTDRLFALEPQRDTQVIDDDFYPEDDFHDGGIFRQRQPNGAFGV
jgi:hypothetical protein